MLIPSAIYTLFQPKIREEKHFDTQWIESDMLPLPLGFKKFVN